ncbi:hypothetical protein CEXT_440631 [Caerostris extrusa]|uniref:Uncharacterized protein n=1 Tax=Caerostris extrusa TaxID=172846 RepID=A0AAV4RE39_CAEEX|nr:hypothetical protein CEXT_440631 [Caerostris extrusa]
MSTNRGLLPNVPNKHLQRIKKIKKKPTAFIPPSISFQPSQFWSEVGNPAGIFTALTHVLCSGKQRTSPLKLKTCSAATKYFASTAAPRRNKTIKTRQLRLWPGLWK